MFNGYGYKKKLEERKGVLTHKGLQWKHYCDTYSIFTIQRYSIITMCTGRYSILQKRLYLMGIRTPMCSEEELRGNCLLFVQITQSHYTSFQVILWLANQGAQASSCVTYNTNQIDILYAVTPQGRKVSK